MGFSSGETQLTDALLSAVFLIVTLTVGQYFSKTVRFNTPIARQMPGYPGA